MHAQIASRPADGRNAVGGGGFCFARITHTLEMGCCGLQSDTLPHVELINEGTWIHVAL